MNGSDAFERSLKETMESYELPYNSADWTEMERQLDEKEGGAWKSSAGMLALLFGGALALGTTIYLMVQQPGGPGKENTALVAMVAPEQDDQSNVVPEAPEQASTIVEHIASAPQQRSAQPVTEQRTEETEVMQPATAAPVENTSSTEISIRPSVTQGCPGTAVEFSARNLPKEGTFLWNFGDGSFSREPQPKHTFSKAGRFEVMLSHSSRSGGMVPEPVSDVIVIHETPEAVFNWLPQDYENTVPSIHFENRSLGGQSFFWDFGDGGTSTIAHPNHVYKTRGNYTVSLTVTNGGGCTDRIEKTVKVNNDYNLLAASTFSPDGDGVEDSFIPDALKTLGVRFHMTIHDKTSGQLLFETSDAQRPWNGRIGGRGEPCRSGDYVWMVEMKDGEKLGGTYNGTVSLVR
ncbi:MAG: PKD domain-containing protein [Flavobacteriales bacterium]|nr:PKD domain-containing protein [Flavobacteriales bacterium]